jgi:hypothetical protein
MNLIYLAMLTERVPIIPHFNPTHISRTSLDTDVVDPNFGEVFDVPRLSKDLRMAILEWWQVKVCPFPLAKTGSFSLPEGP